MSEQKYYSFEIYKNGELAIVLRSDDIQVLEIGNSFYSDMNNDKIPLNPRVKVEDGIIYYGGAGLNQNLKCPHGKQGEQEVIVGSDLCLTCKFYERHNCCEKYVICTKEK